MKTKQIPLANLTHPSYNNFGLGNHIQSAQGQLFEPEPISVTVNTNLDAIATAIESQKKHGVEGNEHSSWQIGVDEAGRGPLLGSVTVGAVLLPQHLSGLFTELDLSTTAICMINDSKKISEKKRDKLSQIIPEVALAYSVVNVPASVIDEINILQASLLGMRIASDELIKQLATDLITHNLSMSAFSDFMVLYDGNKVPQTDDALLQRLGQRLLQRLDQSLSQDLNQEWGANTCIHHQAVIKGDATYSSIAAASILAKVSRDEQMYELAKRYPDYGIEKHKGYPTKAHFEALQTQGVLAEHRRSFAPVQKALQQ